MKNEAGGLLTASEISSFCEQISMILKAGIPVAEGISIMCEDMKNSEGKKILEAIKASTELGEPLNIAIEKTQKFPQYVVDMIKIGEQAGRLDEVLDSLCDYYLREESISKSVKSAVTYPMLMIGMMLIVIGVLITQVLPVFSQVYNQLGSITPFVQNIISVSGTAIIYVAAIIALIIVALLTMFIMNKTVKGRVIMTKFKGSFFMTKNISRQIASGRFASAMAITMSSGLDVDQSLVMASRLVDNAGISEKIEECQKLTNDGTSFSDALNQSGIFSGVYARMVAVGFKTGSADSVMKKLAERYEEEVDEKIDKIIAILEPTLVAILSIIVGIILLSVMLPLMGIMSSIG